MEKPTIWDIVSTIGILLISAVQVIILINQTILIGKQTRTAATTTYLALLKEKDSASGLMVAAHASWRKLDLLDFSNPENVDTEELRETIQGDIPNEAIVDDMRSVCGAGLDPEYDPLINSATALKALAEGELESGVWAADRIRTWMEAATGACRHRMAMLQAAMEESGGHPEDVGALY